MKSLPTKQKNEKSPRLSILIPVYNEAGNLPELFSRLSKVLSGLGQSYEIIAVDDGSRDTSFSVLSARAARDPHIIVIKFQTNFGQTAALAAAIDHANGEVLISLDSDLENSPEDIPRLLKKLDEGYDIVSGWRQGRWQGALLTRRLPSMMANALISRLSGVPLHDYGCTLKAYRAEIIKNVNLYGEMHRFIPAYAA